MKKKELSILLSKLKRFVSPDPSLEQYPTDPEIASSVLWLIESQDGFSGKVVADFGSGTGVLGIGALVLGAKRCYFVDVDKKVFPLLKENLEVVEKYCGKKFNYVLVNKDVRQFNSKVDLVIQNPPFGVQNPHADRLFLLKAMESSPLIYSFHKSESSSFISQICKDNGFDSVLCLKFKFPVRNAMKFHSKKVHFVDVGLWRLSSRQERVVREK